MKQTPRFLLILLLAAIVPALHTAHGQLERDVRFQIAAPGAGSVMLYGSFDGWAQAHSLAPSAGGTWQVTLKLRRGRYEYKFLVDNRWVHNPELPVIDDGFSGKNNMLII